VAADRCHRLTQPTTQNEGWKIASSVAREAIEAAGAAARGGVAAIGVRVGRVP
jgi:hypothetical protein